MSNVSATGGVRYDKIVTYKVADSTTLVFGDPVYLSSGKVAKSTTTEATNIIGFAAEAKTVTTLAAEGQQKYVAVIKKGILSFTGLKDSGSYTSDISIGDNVSLYYDGTNYYVVNATFNPIGTVVEGSMDTVGSSTTILVEVDLTAENIKPSELQFPFTVPTNSKIQFRDTGIYMQSSADGKLTISSDGTGADDITLSGAVTVSGDLLVTGTASIPSVGGTFTGTVQVNDNNNLQFEGVANDLDGFTVNCDSSGDTVLNCTAGQVTLSSKDGRVKMIDSDAATDYLTFDTVAASSRQVIAAEPSGLFRFKDAGDSNNSDVLDLDLTDAASANKLTSAVGFEIETTAGHITLDSAGDIILDPAGNDVIFGVSAGKFTLGATSTSLYGGDSTGDDLKLYANSTDANPSVILNGLGAVDVLVKDQDFTVQYDTSNYLKIEVDSAGVATFTTVTGSTDGMAFVTAVGGISFAPATTVTYTLPAAGYISIDAGTTDTTASSVLAMNVDVNSTNSNAIGLDVDVGTALSAGEIVNGISVDIDGKNTDSATAEMRGIYLTSANTTTGINEGISFAGTWDTAIEINASVTTAVNIVTDSTSASNAQKGVVMSKDVTNATAAGALTSTNSALDISSINASSASASGAITVGNNLVSVTETNSTAVATDDVYSGKVLALAYSATTTSAGTATSTAKGIFLDYNLTETAGTLTVDSTNVVDVDIDFSGTVSVANSAAFNAVNVNINDDAVNVWGTSCSCAGINVDVSGMDVSDTSLTLYGLNVAMPATYGNSTEYGVYVAGDGTTVALCSDDATALTIGGTVTTAISLGAATTSILFGASAGKIVDAATSVAVYGGNTTGDDLKLYANSNDATELIINGLGAFEFVSDAVSGDLLSLTNTATLTGATIGIKLDLDGLTLNGQNLTGLQVLMPATYGAGTEYGVYVSGDGTTVALCSDGAEAVTIGGTVTTGLSIGAATTSILFGAGNGKIVDAASSLSIYGGDTTGDDLVLYANSADANPKVTLNGLGNVDILFKDQDLTFQYDASNYCKVEVGSAGATTLTTVTGTTAAHFEIATGAAGNITIDAAGNVALESAGGSITADAPFTITSTTATQAKVAYDGSNYFSVDVANDGYVTLTSVGTDADFELVSGTGGDIILDSTADIILEPGDDVTVTMPAAGKVFLDAGTTNHTDPQVLHIDVDPDASAVDGILVDLDVAAALTGTQEANCLQVQFDGHALDAGTSFVTGLHMEGATTSGGTTTGIRMLGNVNTAVYLGAAGTVKGIDIAGDHQIGISIESQTTSAIAFGVSDGKIVDAAASVSVYGGNTASDSLKLYGSSADTTVLSVVGGTGLTLAGTLTTAMSMSMDAAEANNAIIGLSISKDLTNSTAAGALASTNSALKIESINATSASASGAVTVANTLTDFTVTNSTAVASADVYSGVVEQIKFSATTTGAGTATASATGLFIDYNLTETAGTLSVDSFSVLNIDYDTVGTISYNAGTFNMINVAMADANTPEHAASTIMNGLQINTSAVDVSDADMTLNGIKVVMPTTYGAATEHGIYVSGDGVTVSVCDDAATAMTIGGTVTTGISFGGTLTTAMAVGACTDVIVMGGDVTGSFLDMDACTGANGQMVSTSGTAATVFAARLKVQTPDGNSGWINIYSTSNEV